MWGKDITFNVNRDKPKNTYLNMVDYTLRRDYNVYLAYDITKTDSNRSFDNIFNTLKDKLTVLYNNKVTGENYYEIRDLGNYGTGHVFISRKSQVDALLGKPEYMVVEDAHIERKLYPYMDGTLTSDGYEADHISYHRVFRNNRYWYQPNLDYELEHDASKVKRMPGYGFGGTSLKANTYFKETITGDEFNIGRDSKLIYCLPYAITYDDRSLFEDHTYDIHANGGRYTFINNRYLIIPYFNPPRRSTSDDLLVVPDANMLNFLYYHSEQGKALQTVYDGRFTIERVDGPAGTGSVSFYSNVYMEEQVLFKPRRIRHDIDIKYGTGAASGTFDIEYNYDFPLGYRVHADTVTFKGNQPVDDSLEE